MPKFRKKPVVVDAEGPWQGHGDERVFGITAYPLVTMDEGRPRCKHCGLSPDRHGWIKTLEGGHVVCPQDWIITGVEGERYPCKPSIFEKTYERVE